MTNEACHERFEVASAIKIHNHNIVESPCFNEINRIPPNLNMCGTQLEDRIIGGGVVVPNSWPWIVGISSWSQNAIDSGFYPGNCSGTIINDRWILTAAHCCEAGVEFRIYFGDHQRDVQGETNGTEYEMIIYNDYVIHPSRDENTCSTRKDDCNNEFCNFDVCLLLTPKSIGIGSKPGVASACLPTQAPVPNNECWVAGWGQTEDGVASKELKSVGVTVLSDKDCVKHHACDDFQLNDDDLCAGDLDGGRDACKGDSGGPLVCHNDGLLTLTGIVSRGIGCAQAGYPGIYGNVFEYTDWIQKVMNETIVLKEDARKDARKQNGEYFKTDILFFNI